MLEAQQLGIQLSLILGALCNDIINLLDEFPAHILAHFVDEGSALAYANQNILEDNRLLNLVAFIVSTAGRKI